MIENDCSRSEKFCIPAGSLTFWPPPVLKLGVLARVSRSTSVETVCTGQGLTGCISTSVTFFLSFSTRGSGRSV